MGELWNFIKNLLLAESWPARWLCGQWSEFHGWLYIISSVFIAAAYLTIPSYLFILVKKRKDFPFQKIIWLFIAFILACGLTHLMDALIFWYPAYRLSAFLLFITAIVSWLTVFGMLKYLPQLMQMRSPSEMANIINERTAELEASNKSLQKLNLDLDNYVYAASHNLKSPITNMEGLLTLIQEEVETGNLPDKILLENMQLSMQRVRSTIQTLTSIIQLEKNPYDDIENIHLPTILKEILSENELMMKQHHVKILTQFEFLTVEYSLLGMKSILHNLISNSIKYSHPDRSPLIEIRAYINKDKKKCISIKDNGLGIDLERNKENIFKLFKRFHTHVEGSGIGLYSIKQLIERKNGNIQVLSTLNQGTEFIVTF